MTGCRLRWQYFAVVLPEHQIRPPLTRDESSEDTEKDKPVHQQAHGDVCLFSCCEFFFLILCFYCVKACCLKSLGLDGAQTCCRLWVELKKLLHHVESYYDVKGILA